MVSNTISGEPTAEFRLGTQLKDETATGDVRIRKLENKVDEDDCVQPAAGWEVALCFVSFFCAFVYAAWDFYMEFGRNPTAKLPRFLMKPGWLTKWMENNPVQMEDDMLLHYKFLIASSLGFLVVSQVTLRKASLTIHYLSTAAYTLAVTTVVLNARAAMYMLGLHIGTIFIGYFSLIAVWLWVLSAMILQNSRYYSMLHSTLDLNDKSISVNIYFPIMGYLYCRSISAGHSLNQMLRQKKLQGLKSPSLLEYLRHQLPRALGYGFYLPWHYAGPILTFDDFCHQIERADRTHWNFRSVVTLTWRAFRLLLWLLLLQVLHHVLPVGAFLMHINSGEQILYKRLVFAMYLHGQNFMLVYIQVYGWPGLLARMDGIQLLDWPDCISRVYTYRKMWRVFDRGLAEFMQHHIYIPMGGSRHGIVRQVAAVAASFVFVSIYHGDSKGVRLWSALNAFQLLVEATACEVYKARVKYWLSLCLSPRNHQRVVAFIIGCNLILTSCFIFLFLVHSTALLFMVEIFKPLVLQRPMWHLLLLLYLSYCSVQISMYYEGRSKRVLKKKS